MGRCICRRECGAAGLTMLEELCTPVGQDFIVPLSTSALMVSIEGLRNQQAMKVTLIFFVSRSVLKPPTSFHINQHAAFCCKQVQSLSFLLISIYQVTCANKDNMTFLSQLNYLILYIPRPTAIPCQVYICKEFIYVYRMVACKLSWLCTSYVEYLLIHSSPI